MKWQDVLHTFRSTHLKALWLFLSLFSNLVQSNEAIFFKVTTDLRLFSILILLLDTLHYPLLLNSLSGFSYHCSYLAVLLPG